MAQNGFTKTEREGLGKGVKRYLVTSALPYANGPLHLGHLVETIQTDIWVRALKFAGNEVYYFCADDTHGTPVMIASQKAGQTPEQFVEAIHKDRIRDFSGFLINFDNYYSTHSEENRVLSEFFYNKAKEKGSIDRGPIMQFYSAADGMFLPDRFVKGTCPNCKSPDQYGDSCEVCGKTYSPKDLIDPRSALSGAVPELKESEHLFFKLKDYQAFLEKWLATGVSSGIKKKLDDWLKDGLRNWDISRDGPYFGFAIPGEKNKFFYVWLDAPVGYMASAKNYFDKKNPEAWDDFWKHGKGEIHHFIGKDIVYFHTLFWPALLEAAGFQKPDAVHVHGFLTIGGEKMSKSRGTLVSAANYLKYLEPEALRYFYASKLGPGLDDLDLSQDDFISRWNADVVGNITNIFSRLCGGILPNLQMKLSKGVSKEGKALKKTALAAAKKSQELLIALEYSKAIREISGLADSINRFIAEKEPWKLIKTDPESTRQCITDALCSAKILAGSLKPIVPSLVTGIENLLNIKELTLENMGEDFDPGHEIHPYRNLSARIDKKEFEAMMAEEKKNADQQESKPAPVKTAGSGTDGTTANGKSTPVEKAGTAEPGIIGIEDLSKVAIVAGKILQAEYVEGADKLLKVQVDVGEDAPRQVFAGIRAAYKPEELTGLTVAVVANLAPRKMKFGVSSAMLLASGEGTGLSLYIPHRAAKPGDRLK